MNRRCAAVCYTVVALCLMAMLVSAQEKLECSGHEETYDIPANKTLTGEGCTESEAKAQVISQLMDPAEKERKIKCPDCSCKKEGEQCITFMWGEDWQRISGQIKLVPVVLPKDWAEKCKSRIGWKATMFGKEKPEKFKTGCACIGKPPE